MSLTKPQPYPVSTIEAPCNEPTHCASTCLVPLYFRHARARRFWQGQSCRLRPSVGRSDAVELSLHLPAAVCVHDRESGRSHPTPKNEFLAARDLAGHGVIILHSRQLQAQQVWVYDEVINVTRCFDSDGQQKKCFGLGIFWAPYMLLQVVQGNYPPPSFL